MTALIASLFRSNLSNAFLKAARAIALSPKSLEDGTLRSDRGGRELALSCNDCQLQRSTSGLRPEPNARAFRPRPASQVNRE